MFYNDYLISMFFPPILPTNNYNKPTIYSLLESIVNYGKDEKTRIKDLAKVGRLEIFDFDYPLSEKISKEDFECMILNHFLMRRIGFETITAFKIQLNVKLNEIMPMYNKMFDSLEFWNILEDGKTTTKTGNIKDINNSSSYLNNISNNNTENISDRRSSDTPQNQLQDVRNGNYVTNYDYDTNNAKSNDNSTSTGTQQNNRDNNYTEEIKESPNDKVLTYKEFQELKSIYTLIFKDLECLFYQLL